MVRAPRLFVADFVAEIDFSRRAGCAPLTDKIFLGCAPLARQLLRRAFSSSFPLTSSQSLLSASLRFA